MAKYASENARYRQALLVLRRTYGQGNPLVCETAVMVADLPESVAWFVRQLESSGFTRTHEEVGTMDSAVIAFHRTPVEIRLVKGRSQWSADLIADGWPERDRVVFPLFHGFGLADIAHPS